MVNNPNHDEQPEPIDAEDLESTPLPGNRPADNALRATAESDLNLSWQGGEGAADFLGLDQDVARPAPISIELDEPQAEAAIESAGALLAEQPTIPLEEEQYDEQLEMAPVSAEPEPEAPEFETQELAAEAHEPETDESNWLLDSDGSVDEPSGEQDYANSATGELEVAEALDTSFMEEASSRRPMKLVLLASLVVLTAGGTWYLSDTPVLEQPVEVASVGSPTTNTSSTPDSSIVSSTPDGEALDSSQASSESATTEEDAELLVELTELIAVSEGGKVAATSSGGPISENSSETPASEVAVIAGEPEATPNDDGRAERVVQINTSEMVLLPDYSSSLRLASETELGMLWTESTVPFEKFEADKRILTPKVGRVRVVIAGDEIFEGNLYAVGEGNVWIDSKIGRVALTTKTVRDVQRLSGNDHTPELGGVGSQNLAGLPRVRVKGAGGNFYGKVVAREGDLVTLIPDSGGRIRLKSSEIEVVGNMRTSLVRAELE